jgi:hypothetical protein
LRYILHSSYELQAREDLSKPRTSQVAYSCVSTLLKH